LRWIKARRRQRRDEAAMLADCLRSLTALGPDGLPTLLGAMLLAGLTGGATQCAGMCGPFVVAQVAAGAGGERGPAAGSVGSPARHCCPASARLLGYGALAGGTAGFVSVASGLRLPLAGLLALAAAAATGSAVAGALVTLTFVLGTLPALCVVAWLSGVVLAVMALRVATGL